MAHSTPRIVLVGSAAVRTLAARLSGAEAHVHALALDASNRASDQHLQALLAEPGTQDDMILTAFEHDAAARSFFASESARALRHWPGAMLDTSAITPSTLRQIVPEAPARFHAARFGQRHRDGRVSSVLYIDRAALGAPAVMRIARFLADDVVAIGDGAKAKALAIVEGLLVGVNAAIVHEALMLAEASGVASETIIPLILKGSGATAVMALRRSAAAMDAVHAADDSSRLRAGLAGAFVAAREVEHPLLFASVAATFASAA